MKNDSLSLHQCLQKLFDYLASDKKVILDDTLYFRNPNLRKSLIEKIRASIKSCDIKCIVIYPLGGLLQCLWANEWALAERTPLRRQKKDIKHRVLDIEELKDFYNETTFTRPTKEEGYDQLEEKTISLFANRKKFEFQHQVSSIKTRLTNTSEGPTVRSTLFISLQQ